MKTVEIETSPGSGDEHNALYPHAVHLITELQPSLLTDCKLKGGVCPCLKDPMCRGFCRE